MAYLQKNGIFAGRAVNSSLGLGIGTEETASIPDELLTPEQRAISDIYKRQQLMILAAGVVGLGIGYFIGSR
jgi:hypothetical protein